MIVVHGWWSRRGTTDDHHPDGVLVLWAEDAEGPAEPPRRRGRRPKVLDHPFALSSTDLTKALDLGSLPRGGFRPGTAVLGLPTAGRGPTSSPELARPTPPTASEPPKEKTAQWRVPTVELDADAALELLRPASEALPDAGVLPGADVRALRHLAAFAADLVARGRVLPTALAAGHDAGRARAAWRPLVTGADAEWLRAAVAGMPASLTCAVPAAGEPDTLAAQVASAVDALVDAAVRAALPRPRRQPRATSVAAAWRAALSGDDRTFPASATQLLTLQAALADWQRDAVRSRAVRACFRLVEPAEPEGDVGSTDTTDRTDDAWFLHFGLQAVEEPSLVVDAEHIWRGRGGKGLARHVADPQETLLAELGRAVRLYPAMEGALRTARPASLALHTEGAHAFLTEAAPLLLASGFGVILPGWWTAPSRRLGAKLKASTPSQPAATANKAGIGREGLVEFDWQLAVGDEALTDREVADLLEAHQPLVRVRGQWMQVDADRLARARSFLSRRDRRSGTMTVGEVLHAIGSPDDGPGGLPVVGIEADGWLGDLLSGETERRLQPVPAPDGFAGTLRPYQQRGLSWLAFLESVGLGGLLADDMGLGKTVQLLALIARDAGQPDARPTLLVCPMSVVGNWQREAARFAPAVRVHVHHGAERPRGKAFEQAVAESDLVVTTYSLLARDAAALRKVSWHRVVLDEAQAIKNAATKVAVAARSVPAQRRIAVTGTPVENRLADLWSLMEFANPGLLGKPKEFKERFAVPVECHGDPDATRRLRALTQPFVLRRVKTDRSIISDLPEKVEMDVVCSLTREQAALYQAVVDDMLDRIATTEGIERRGLVLATMTKLKQICNHPAHFLRDGSRLAGRSGKLARLEEVLDEVLSSGEKALLFTQYAEFGDMLRTHLSARFGREVAFLHGGVSKAARDAMVARFQDGGRVGPSMLVLSLKAGGTGLTLTAANHVVHVDRWWNPAVEDQATDRAFRIGQTRAVQVRKLLCAGTLEEKIAAMISGKRELAESVVGTGEAWLTELSTAQLRQLFALEAGSVVE